MTDHHCLHHLDGMKDHNSRLTRWSLSLQPYSYEVKYRPGVRHQNADGLSGQVWSQGSIDKITSTASNQEEGNVTGRT